VVSVVSLLRSSTHSPASLTPQPLKRSMVGTYGHEDGQTDAFAAVMEILRRRLDGEVAPWDTSCGKTFDKLSVRVPGPIPCTRGGCHSSTRTQVSDRFLSRRHLFLRGECMKTPCVRLGSSGLRRERAEGGTRAA
jgi:hypothetical protein